MPRFRAGMPSYLRQLELIQSMGEFTPEPQIDFDRLLRNARRQVGPPTVFTGGLNTGLAAGAGSHFQNFLGAIAQQESGGNYGAVNPSSGALGKYQIMPFNVGPWSQQVLGRRISPNQFLRNPRLQETIARSKLSQYYRRYGPRGAAEAWYGGPGSIGKSYVRGYSNSILRRMGRR